MCHSRISCHCAPHNHVMHLSSLLIVIQFCSLSMWFSSCCCSCLFLLSASISSSTPKLAVYAICKTKTCMYIHVPYICRILCSHHQWRLVTNHYYLCCSLAAATHITLFSLSAHTVCVCVAMRFVYIFMFFLSNFIFRFFPVHFIIQ